MTQDDESLWIRGEDAAGMLGISARSIQRYAGEGPGKIRIRKYSGSKRFFYYLPDVEALAEQFGAARRPPEAPAAPKPELVPAGELLGYLRQRDDELRATQAQLQAAALELGQLRAEVTRRQLVDEQLQTVSAERDEVRRQIAQLQGQRRLWIGISLALLVLLTLAAFYLWK